jgi:hypothetical protein
MRDNMRINEVKVCFLSLKNRFPHLYFPTRSQAVIFLEVKDSVFEYFLQEDIGEESEGITKASDSFILKKNA